MSYCHTLEYLTLQRHYKIFEDLADCSCIVQEIHTCGLITKSTMDKISACHSSVDKNRYVDLLSVIRRYTPSFMFYIGLYKMMC